MDSEGTSNKWLQELWHIDLEWYRANGCSFFVLAEESLCSKCRRRLKKEARAEDIMKAVYSCCGKKDDYITAAMPVMAAVFRYFLANNNQPVELEALAKELSELRGTTAGCSPSVLHRLLLNDRYYGMTMIAEELAEKSG